MTFSYTPADSPAIWMQFVPARESAARPADEDNRLTEGMVHTGMVGKTPVGESEEKRADEEVSTAADNISEKTADSHIPSVDDPSQLRDTRLAECEYQRDCISVGKEQADRLPGDSFDFLKLTTITDRGRDAVVVETRKSADQCGSPVDCSALILSANNLPKECCVVASGPDGKIRRNDRLCHPKIDRLPSSPMKSSARYNCRAVGDRHRVSSAKYAPVSRPGCWHQIDDDIARTTFHSSCADDGNRAAPWPCESAIYRTTAPQTIPTPTLGPKVPQLCDSSERHFLAARCHRVMPSMTI